MSDVIVIGVAGGTGSGKTTLVKALVNRFGDNITVLSHDNYYKRHDELSYEERTKLNYDHPDAFDTDMMIEHLQQLKSGKAIECPTYDYTIHNRAEETITIEPRKVIVVEGILIFATITNDTALREKTAALWSKLNGLPITPDMMSCTGCRVDGPKTPFCDKLCPIHTCVREKGFDTCADCAVGRLFDEPIGSARVMPQGG